MINTQKQACAKRRKLVFMYLFIFQRIAIRDTKDKSHRHRHHVISDHIPLHGSYTLPLYLLNSLFVFSHTGVFVQIRRRLNYLFNIVH